MNCFRILLLNKAFYNDDGISAGVAPVFENCSFKNITLKGIYQNMQKEIVSCDAIELCGFDEPGYELKNIEFLDVTLGDIDNPTTQTISLRLCNGISFKNIKCL